MSDLATTLPAPARPSLNGPRLAILEQARALAGQPAVRRSLPFAGAFGAIAAAGLAWTYLSAPPQRVLYSELGDSEKAAVVQSLDKASIENERNALLLRTDFAAEVTCVQVAGLVARRILCYVKPGDRLSRGQRYGFIRFGSRVDLYLPGDARARVAVGDKVYAGQTIVASFAKI